MIFLNIYFHLILGSALIIIMSAFLGGKCKFYDKYAWWDRLIHFLSGILFVCFGAVFSRNIEELNALHILLFSFSFSIMLHVIWEVAEYIVDCKVRGNHQRWQKTNTATNHNPANAIQPAGLIDTMNDTLFCIYGSLISCIVWLFIL